MNRLRKNSIASNAKRNPIAIMVDANCACPFDYFTNNADFKVLAQPAKYLNHSITDSRDQQSLELFYLSSDPNHWQNAQLLDFDEAEFSDQISQQLHEKSAVLLLVGDEKLLSKNRKTTALLNDSIHNQSVESVHQSSMVSQLLQCHSVFAGQAALYHALMETLPRLLEGKNSKAHHSQLRDSLAVMQTLKSQVNLLNSHLATWFICDERSGNDEFGYFDLGDKKDNRTIMDKWFGNRPVYFYYHQKMHQECKKRNVRASVEYVVEQLILRTKTANKYPDVFFSYAGDLKHIETKSWWQQVVKSMYDAGFMPHLTQAPLAQALTLGPRSLSIALIES